MDEIINQNKSRDVEVVENFWTRRQKGKCWIQAGSSNHWTQVGLSGEGSQFHQFHLTATGMDTFHCPRLPQAPSWDISRDAQPALPFSPDFHGISAWKCLSFPEDHTLLTAEVCEELPCSCHPSHPILLPSISSRTCPTRLGHICLTRARWGIVSSWLMVASPAELWQTCSRPYFWGMT